MTSTSILLILIGLFVVINAPNFVGVIKGDKTISQTKTTTTSTTPTSTTKSTSGGN